jgi:hypothetical protein
MRCNRWTEKEDEIVRRYAGDYAAMRQALPKRTYYALRQRARVLGLVPSRKTWTAGKIHRLRRYYPTASRCEIEKLFPGDTYEELRRVAKSYGIRRRLPVKVSGYSLVDSIRFRGRELGLSAAELDRKTKSGTYFYKAAWLLKNMNYRALTKAVEVLGGELRVEFED